jgi:hypothetical protein
MNPTTYTGTYTGTYTLGVASSVNRDSSKAVTLDGSTGYVNLGTLGNLGSLHGNGITIQCRVRTTATGITSIYGHFPASFFPGIQIAINQSSAGTASSGRLRFYLADNTNKRLSRAHNSATSINDGNWHTVAWVIDVAGNTGSIFLDGVSLAMTTTHAETPVGHSNYARNVYCGALNYNGTLNTPLNGSIQKFAIFNRALTLAEHQAFHLACVKGAFGSIAGQIG